MSLKKSLFLFVIPFVVLVGCDSNPTNAPTDAEVQQAKKDQIAAIDKDTTMSAQDKENLKRAKGFLPGGPPGNGGASRGKK